MKIIIGAFVGALLMFLCQFLSHGLLDWHRPAMEYTPHQEEILSFLGSKLEKDGGFFLPNVPAGTSAEDMEKYQQESMGKPWAQIYYHTRMDVNMGMNMACGFAVDLLIVFTLIWLLGKMAKPGFSGYFLGSLAVGMMIFLFIPYTSHIWFKTFDLYAHLLDALLSWACVGAWLGYWMNRK